MLSSFGNPQRRALSGCMYFSHIIPPFLWRDESYRQNLIAAVEWLGHKSPPLALTPGPLALLHFYFSLHNVLHVFTREGGRTHVRGLFRSGSAGAEITERRRRGQRGSWTRAAGRAMIAFIS